jgi:hypothetical protein
MADPRRSQSGNTDGGEFAETQTTRCPAIRGHGVLDRKKAAPLPHALFTARLLKTAASLHDASVRRMPSICKFVEIERQIGQTKRVDPA